MEPKRFETKMGAKRAVMEDRVQYMPHRFVMDGNSWAVMFYCPTWPQVRAMRAMGYEAIYRKPEPFRSQVERAARSLAEE